MGGEWIGTEITKELCDGQKIIHADFSVPQSAWIGKFDMIYTNSLDHARYPWKTIKVWVSSLSETGRLYVEWTRWHSWLGKKDTSSIADCFAATDWEYLGLFQQAAKVEDVITIQEVKFDRRIFVVH